MPGIVGAGAYGKARGCLGEAVTHFAWFSEPRSTALITRRAVTETSGLHQGPDALMFMSVGHVNRFSICRGLEDLKSRRDWWNNGGSENRIGRAAARQCHRRLSEAIIAELSGRECRCSLPIS